MNSLDDRHCAYYMIDHRYATDDGSLRLAKIFFATYIPRLAPAEEKIVYETQKGKNLSKAVNSAHAGGAIEITAHEGDELKRKVYAVSGIRRKTVYKDEDEDVGEDWMDE